MTRVYAAFTVLSIFMAEAPPPPSGASLHLDSLQSGASPGHRLIFDVRAGSPEIVRAEISYPAGFHFLGFDRGTAGEPVGTYELDVNQDGAPDRSRPVLALSRDAAYVDQLSDGTFEAAIDPLLYRRGGATLDLSLPFGGDGNAATVSAPFSASVSLALRDGILMNPSQGGRYLVGVRLASVDPDSGGANDGMGTAGTVSEFELPLRIEGPSNVPFHRLVVEHFDLKRNGGGRYRFQLHGRFVLGRASDGLDLPSESVSVTLDWLKRPLLVCAFQQPGCRPSRSEGLDVSRRRWFTQTIAGSSFDDGHGRLFRGSGPGIEKFLLLADGRFSIDARDLALSQPGHAIAFTLRVGDDTGTDTAAADSRGRW